MIETPTQLLIDGEWRDALSGATFEVYNPATEEVIANVASADASDVDLAVKAARRAFEFGEWAVMRPMQRERLLHRLADLLEARADGFARTETLNQGKLLALSRSRDLPAAIQRIRYMAGWASKIEGRTTTPSINAPGVEFQAFSLREPIGVVGQIVPWNFPLQMAVGKIAPALAAGCTVVLKPAEQTPLTALMLGELIVEAGFPPGVVNIITGFGETAGAAIVDHPDVQKIAFTGSTAVGKKIGAQCMNTMKRVSLELGGKSPVIVGPDADIKSVISGAANGVFYNQGQVCIAGSRLYVHDSIFDEVVEGVSSIAKSMKIGPGVNEDSKLGPLVSRAQMERVLNYIEIGKAEGARVHAGGARRGDQGFFVEPTVFSGLGQDSRCVREEIFGPVLVAAKYSSEDEAAALANDTEYGLGASVWTRDLSFAHKMTKKIRAGTVWVNCHAILDASMPFGGFKQSGLGREMGLQGVELYTELKSVIMRL